MRDNTSVNNQRKRKKKKGNKKMNEAVMAAKDHFFVSKLSEVAIMQNFFQLKD